MKLPLAILVYLLIGIGLGSGILLAVKGSFVFLIVGALFYVVAFAWVGCLSVATRL